ncbi:MAG: mobile mystery protein A [bacterium]|nr:mobile mystery protein A [bacterium]
MEKKSLQLQQLNEKMVQFTSLKQVVIPPLGWIKAIRTTISMSMEQLGKKLSISKQAIWDIEKREKDGSITIKLLKEIGRAMDMQLVYGFVPNDGSLDAMIERRAIELATQIVLRTSSTMNLENQGNSKERIKKAIIERAYEIKSKTPKILWD